MFSGLDRKQAAERRQQSVAWAWIKARAITKDRTKTTHATLTKSVLLTTDCSSAEEISSWRESLAALTHRSLARQICDQFYDLSIVAAWRARSAEMKAAEPALSGALPSYCRMTAEAEAREMRERALRKAPRQASVMIPVLLDKPQRSAVLIPLRSKAA